MKIIIIPGIKSVRSSNSLIQWFILLGYRLLRLKPDYDSKNASEFKKYLESRFSDAEVQIFSWRRKFFIKRAILPASKQLQEEISKNTILIGHSAGGLVTKYFLEKYVGSDVIGCIVVGVPHNTKTFSEKNIRITNVFSNSDILSRIGSIILRKTSWVQRVSGKNVSNICFENIGHNELMTDATTDTGEFKGKSLYDVYGSLIEKMLGN